MRNIGKSIAVAAIMGPCAYVSAHTNNPDILVGAFIVCGLLWISG